MATDLATRTGDEMTAEELTRLEAMVKEGDLSKLSWPDRWGYYLQVCERLGLSAITRPFDFIEDRGKVTLYANKECAAQLRKRRGVSITQVDNQIVSDMYVCTVHAELPDGTKDVDMGVVPIKGDKGTFGGIALANAMKKALTQGKRRVTLSICGLSFLDETEVDYSPHVRVATPEQAQRNEYRPASTLAVEGHVAEEPDEEPMSAAPPQANHSTKPATDKQKETIRKLAQALVEELPYNLETMSNSEASAVITRQSADLNRGR